MTHLIPTKTLLAGLIATVAIVAMTTSATAAGQGSDSLRAVFAIDGEISATEAKRLAYSHLQQLGFTRPGNSHMSARVRGVRFADGRWLINVAYGGSIGHNRAVILINGFDGRILASPLVEYVTGKPFERQPAGVEMAESQEKPN